MKNIMVIIGSAGSNSSNEKLAEYLFYATKDHFNTTLFKNLKTLPHFDPELSIENPPQEIIDFRKKIENADGIIICTPEYVFSIPSGLKNAIEWCVSTTIFESKPTGLITASAAGQKGHEELQLIMKTMMAKFTNQTTLLINGIKGKFDDNGKINNIEIKSLVDNFIEAFKNLLSE
jgi:chromate reductase